MTRSNSQENLYFINIVRKKLHNSWKHFFPVHVLNNHILWGEKRTTLKATTLYFSYRHFSLIFFSKVKKKGKGKVPLITPPPSPSHLPLQNRQPLKVMGFFSQYNPQCFSRRISAHWLRITQHDNAMLRFAKTLDDGDGDEEEKWEEGRRRVCGRKMGWGGRAEETFWDKTRTTLHRTLNPRVWVDKRPQYSSWVWTPPSRLCIDHDPLLI